jgi:hypothetical protein
MSRTPYRTTHLLHPRSRKFPLSACGTTSFSTLTLRPKRISWSGLRSLSRVQLLVLALASDPSYHCRLLHQLSFRCGHRTYPECVAFRSSPCSHVYALVQRAPRFLCRVTGGAPRHKTPGWNLRVHHRPSAESALAELGRRKCLRVHHSHKASCTARATFCQPELCQHIYPAASSCVL